MHVQLLTQFGQQYSCGAYGSGSFGEGACETQPNPQPQPQPGTNPGGFLGDTGYDVLLPAALALALILAAGILLVKKLKRRDNKKASR